MADVSHLWGGDLVIGATGDLALSVGDDVAQERILRRLLTSTGDYIWQPDYGAGLPAMVGQPSDGTAVRSLVRSQIFDEPSVATSPEPVIGVSSDQAGTMVVQIQYVDSVTGTTRVLSFPVGG